MNTPTNKQLCNTLTVARTLSDLAWIFQDAGSVLKFHGILPEVVVNVVDFGIPANRTRRATVISLDEALVWDIGCSLDDITLLCRQCVLDGDIFFRAPPRELAEEKQRMAQSQMKPPNSKWEDVLGIGCKLRMLRYRNTPKYLSLLKAGKTRIMNIDQDPQDRYMHNTPLYRGEG